MIRWTQEELASMREWDRLDAINIYADGKTRVHARVG